jgi:thioredoxin 1
MKKVLMFSAAWCGPCRASKPVFSTLKESKTDYQYEIVDIDENPIMATNFGITAVPTFIVMEDDREIDRVLGNVNKLKEIL